MTGHMTVAEACDHFGVSEKTIRRWIHSKRLDAHKNGRGSWVITLADKRPDNARPDDRTDDRPPNAGLVEQMRSEIAHLRDQLSARDKQIDQLSQLLAMTTHQNGELTKQLPPAKVSFTEWILSRLTFSRSK